MRHFILIDNHSGFVFGEVDCATEIEAARQLDESLGEFGRTYEEHGPNYRPAHNEPAYHVYEGGEVGVTMAPDGQDQTAIGNVELLCRKAAVVTVASCNAT